MPSINLNLINVNKQPYSSGHGALATCVDPKINRDIEFDLQNFVGNEDTKSYAKATTCGPLVYIKREEYTLRKDENETD